MELFPTRLVVRLGWKVAGFWISPVVLGGKRHYSFYDRDTVHKGRPTLAVVGG